MTDTHRPARALPSGRLVGLCRRCLVQYSDVDLCGLCLRTVQSDAREKRRVLLPDGGAPDALSAFA